MTVRVLHVHSGNLWGGVESMLLTIVREERRLTGMTSEFALCFDAGFGAALARAGAPVHLLGEVRASRPWTARRARRRLDDVLRERGPRITVVHSSWSAALFGARLARGSAPYVEWAHAPSRGPWWQRALSPRPAALVCNSEYTRRARLQERSLRAEVIYCPVAPPGPATDRAATRASLGVTDPDTPVVLMAARMERWKGHGLLLRALERLANRPGWVCWIAGGAQTPAEQVYQDGLARAVARGGLDGRVRLLGQRADVPELMAAADVYCQPNEGAEPFGISFVEALWAGLPVVTTRMGAAPEIVDEHCGRLVAPRDDASLAAELGALVSDAVRRREIGAHGPARARALCGPETQLPAIEALFGSL